MILMMALKGWKTLAENSIRLHINKDSTSAQNDDKENTGQEAIIQHEDKDNLEERVKIDGINIVTELNTSQIQEPDENPDIECQHIA